MSSKWSHNLEIQSTDHKFQSEKKFLIIKNQNFNEKKIIPFLNELRNMYFVYIYMYIYQCILTSMHFRNNIAFLKHPHTLFFLSFSPVLISVLYVVLIFHVYPQLLYSPTMSSKKRHPRCCGMIIWWDLNYLSYSPCAKSANI